MGTLFVRIKKLGLSIIEKSFNCSIGRCLISSTSFSSLYLLRLSSQSLSLSLSLLSSQSLSLSSYSLLSLSSPFLICECVYLILLYGFSKNPIPLKKEGEGWVSVASHLYKSHCFFNGVCGWIEIIVPWLRFDFQN